ncbi:hypothetical protein POM88_024721 [Heracleum sosnowskyi]|uniref:Uncharacterized protein n=1 Tax=Heracleum sosnowskyi TaxID=360622 RepID=A0AAD8I2L4_9APIA|nr:hypothetical protein POM88_024721 [Heracleum sosnowskyi]
MNSLQVENNCQNRGTTWVSSSWPFINQTSFLDAQDIERNDDYWSCEQPSPFSCESNYEDHLAIVICDKLGHHFYDLARWLDDNHSNVYMITGSVLVKAYPSVRYIRSKFLGDNGSPRFVQSHREPSISSNTISRSEEYVIDFESFEIIPSHFNSNKSSLQPCLFR